jgi:hypothetical protein
MQFTGVHIEYSLTSTTLHFCSRAHLRELGGKRVQVFGSSLIQREASW